MTLIVLKPHHDDAGYRVSVHDDRDDWELFATRDAYPSLEAAIHAACDELKPDERVVGVFEVEEA